VTCVFHNSCCRLYVMSLASVYFKNSAPAYRARYVFRHQRNEKKYNKNKRRRKSRTRTQTEASTPHRPKPWSKCSIIKLGGFLPFRGKLIQPVDPQACFQMSFFRPRTPQRRQRLGLRPPQTPLGSLQRSPRLPSWI